MNERDSEFIEGLFLERGYKLADSPERSDIVVFNTCSVRQHAEERAISNISRLMHGQKDKIYVVVGCAAQALGDKLFKRLPRLDIVCGTGEIARLPELVGEAGGSRILALDGMDTFLPKKDRSYRRNKTHAYVSIMRGCDNFCSYCIVPYVRGRERSRDALSILEEIKGLVDQGIMNITLLGQNVNSYKGFGGMPCNSGQFCNFVELLKLVNNIKGIRKIGFMTNHPKDATDDLFEAIRDLENVEKRLHLPLQSGSDKILRLMNRQYTRKKYLGLVRRARKAIPHLRLTTDVIVGFPGETEKDFRATLSLIRDIKFDLAYIFKYSPRPGTKAASLEDDVPVQTKKKRHKAILDLQRKISKKGNLREKY